MTNRELFRLALFPAWVAALGWLIPSVGVGLGWGGPLGFIAMWSMVAAPVFVAVCAVCWPHPAFGRRTAAAIAVVWVLLAAASLLFLVPAALWALADRLPEKAFWVVFYTLCLLYVALGIAVTVWLLRTLLRTPGAGSASGARPPYLAITTIAALVLTASGVTYYRTNRPVYRMDIYYRTAPPHGGVRYLVDNILAADSGRAPDRRRTDGLGSMGVATVETGAIHVYALFVVGTPQATRDRVIEQIRRDSLVERVEITEQAQQSGQIDLTLPEREPAK